MKKLSLTGKIYILIFFLILYIPIAVLFLFSFNNINSTSVFGGFSLHWYEELVKDAATRVAFQNTLYLAVSSSVLATLFGTIFCVGYQYSRAKHYKGLLMTVNNIPMMNPDIVTGISMMLLFVFVGTLLHKSGILNFWTLLIAHITFELPYVILNILPRFRQMDQYLVEAAEDLGCTWRQAFFKVVLPQIKSGIISGAIMAFTLSLDDFVISYFVSGPEFQTLPIRIYSMTKKRVTPDMYALSTLIFVVMFLLLILINIIENREESKRTGLQKAFRVGSRKERKK